MSKGVRRSHFVDVPYFRPELMLVAEEQATGQMVGDSITLIEPEWIERTGRKEGYINPLGVVREARQRGLGTGLLIQALHTLHEAGMEGAHLHAHAENLTGAIRLYARAGFTVRKTFISYRMAIREG